MDSNKKYFFNDSLNQIFWDHLKKNQNVINDEYENDFEKKISYAISALFDNSGISDIHNNGIDYSISKKFILDEENDLDVVYYDSKNENKKETVVLIKYLDVNNIGEINIERDILPTMNNFLSIIENWTRINNEENISNELASSKQDVIDKINEIIDEIGNEDLKDDQGRVKKNKINFRLVFIIGDLNSYKESFNKTITQIKKDLKYSSESIIKKLDNFFVDLYFESDILNNIKSSNVNNGFVQFGQLEMDEANNVLKYSNVSDSSLMSESLVVNISAKSLRNLWKEYENGLLGMNVRFYVKKKKIDDKIIESMSNQNNKEFWLKNNGLVILCENYEINGKYINLKTFSVVNGGQTTYNIGNLKELDNEEHQDFFVLAKVIVIKELEVNNIEINEFANSIAEATNTQKPINDAVLLQSNPILASAKKEWINKKIFIGTKKGEPRKHDWINKEKWRFIDYTRIIQIDAAFSELIPGTARNSKNILIKKDRIEDVFGINIRNNEKSMLDLLKFDFIVNKLDTKKSLTKENFYGDKGEQKKYETFVKYGKFFSISLLRVLKILLEFPEAKNEYWEIIDKPSIDTKDAKKQEDVTKWSRKWWSRIQDKRIFKNEDINHIEHWWKNIVKHVLGADFKDAVNKKSYDNSNFAKINKSFYQDFMSVFINRFNENKSKFTENIFVSEIKFEQSDFNKIFTFDNGKCTLIENSKKVNLLKGSIIPKLESRGYASKEYQYKLKEDVQEWIKENSHILENNGDSYILSENVVLTASKAALLVSNKLQSFAGPDLWRNESGQSINDLNKDNGNSDYEEF